MSKAISAGNSAHTNIADYLEYFAADPETDVVLAYLEGVPDGPHFVDAVRALTQRKPLVLVKGGAAAEGQRAALSHTGSLATDDRVFDGLCRQFGVLRAPTIEHAFEWAATLATQPLSQGRRVVGLYHRWRLGGPDRRCLRPGRARPDSPPPRSGRDN